MVKQIRQFVTQPIPSLVLVTAIAWVAVDAFFAALGFDFMISDVMLYWREAEAFASSSFDLSTIYTAFHHDHVPFYSILIGLMYTAVPSLSPVVHMQAVNFLAAVLGAVAVYLTLSKLNTAFPWLGAVLFALFPLVGVTYAVYPIADGLAILFIAVAILAYVRGSDGLLILAVAVGPLVHKVTWPVLGLLVAIGLWQKRVRLWMLLPIAFPFVLYWLAGVLHGETLLWVIGRYGEFASRRTLPVFDGLFGPIITGGGVREWAKSLLVLAVYLLAVWLLVSRSWRREPVLISVVVPIVLWGTLYVAVLIWPIMRFARLMIMPLWLYLDTHTFRHVDGTIALPHRTLWYLLCALCFLSQFAWAYYIARVFFAR